MPETDLKDDCARCAGLCCVGLALDRGPDFAIDKPAGIPCPNLDAGCACTIHARLSEAGFPGCVRYTCRGAGQRVVQEIFGGRSWREDPALLGPMLEAFGEMRGLHDRIAMLRTAARLPLGEAEERCRRELLERLESAVPGDRTALAALAGGPLPGEVDSFLRSLAPDMAPASARDALDGATA